jgi:hypothetical protein
MAKKKRVDQTNANTAPSKQDTPYVPAPPVVKRQVARRMVMLGISGLLCFIGLVCGYFYFTSMNMIAAVAAALLLPAGGIMFRSSWKSGHETFTSYVGSPQKGQVNSLSLYKDKIVFEDVNEPKGYPWRCGNDGKQYYVNVEKEGSLAPFTLPDQQYYDPRVFAERVLELPAHRRIFQRRQNIFQKLSPMLLILGIGLVLILIITTTGQPPAV